MAENIIKSYSIKGNFEKTSDGVVVSGSVETSNDKKITTLNGTATKNGVYVCGFNLGGHGMGMVNENEGQEAEALNYTNAKDDSLLAEVGPTIRAVIAQLKVEVSSM